MKKYWKECVLAIMVAFLIVPLVVAWMMSFSLINTETSNDWIGFWGGYLGAILGGIITLWVMWKTLQTEKNNREREERIAYFNNIVHLWAELSKSINEVKSYIDRCISENEKDNIEKVCVGEAQTTSVFLELRITLATRQSTYVVDELLQELQNLEVFFNDMMTLYTRVAQYGFKPIPIRDELQDRANNLVARLANYASCLEKTVSKNLYN